MNVNEFHYKMSEKFSELHPYYFVVFMNLLNLLQFYIECNQIWLTLQWFYMAWNDLTGPL